MGAVGTAGGIDETGVVGTTGAEPVAVVMGATSIFSTAEAVVSGWRCADVGVGVVGTAEPGMGAVTGGAASVSGCRCIGAGGAVGGVGIEPGVAAAGITGIGDGRCAAAETAVPPAAVSGGACMGMAGVMEDTAVGDDKSDSLSTGCRCTGVTTGVMVGCGAGGVGADAAAALNAGVPAVSGLGVDAVGDVVADCGRETNRPNRCPMRPKSEGEGVAETAASVMGTAVSAGDDTASAGASCTDGRSGSSLCR